MTVMLLRSLKSVSDGFRKLLGHREGTHVDDQLIDLAILVEAHLIDHLKLLAFDLALKAKSEATNSTSRVISSGSATRGIADNPTPAPAIVAAIAAASGA